MIAQAVVAVSSVLGAISFFVSGMFFGRISRETGAERTGGIDWSDDVSVSPDRFAVAGGRREKEETVFEVGASALVSASSPYAYQSPVSTATNDPLIETRSEDRVELEVWRLQQQAQHLQATLDQAENENRRLHTELAEMHRLRERRGKVWAEVHRLQEKEQSLGSLREERRHLADRLNEVQGELRKLTPLKERLDAAERERDELAAKLQAVGGYLEELARRRVENDRLRVQLREITELKHRSAELEEELGAVRAQQAGAWKVRMHFPRSGLAEAMEVSIRPALDELAKSERYRAAVISDDLGLAVGGFGEHIDTMAAMAAAYGDLDGRLHDVLSADHMRLLGAKLSGDLFLCTVPLQASSEGLLLTTLTVGGGPSREDIRMLEDRLHSRKSPQVAFLGER